MFHIKKSVEMSQTTTKNPAEIQFGRVKVLEGHTNSVLSVCIKDNLIISGSFDKTIKIWDIESGKGIKTLEGHKDCVNSVAIKDNLVISGSDDKTIKIWDVCTGLCLKTLEGHTHWVNSVAIKDNLIISGSYDKTIKITPITLFPNELDKFQQVINSYWLPEYLEQQLNDCFKPDKD